MATYQKSSMLKLRKLSPSVVFNFSPFLICGTFEKPDKITVNTFRHCLNSNIDIVF